MRRATARSGPAGGWLVLLALSTAVAGCSHGPTGAVTGSHDAALFIRAPLNSTVATTSGLVAIVPMGKLDDPLNTFWQLFVRPNATARWTLETPPGVADNGGLVVSASPAPAAASLLAGFEPSQDLVFSPLALTADDGASWSPGLVPGGLAAVPDALAASASAGSLALVRAGGGEVLRSTGDPTAWSKLVNRTVLASSVAGRSCAVGQFTAVALDAAGGALVGTTCAAPGVVGIFGPADGGWRLVGPRLSGGARSASTSVLRLVQANDVVSGLVAARTGSVTSLIAVTEVAAGAWSHTAALALDRRGRLVSTGVEPNGSFVVLQARHDGSLILDTETAPGGGWRSLPAPPPGTATVAVGSGGEVAALAVDSTRFTDWRLAAAAGTWSKIGTVTVPIQFGSSS